jgi:hypothetical protein
VYERHSKLSDEKLGDDLQRCDAASYCAILTAADIADAIASGCHMSLLIGLPSSSTEIDNCFLLVGRDHSGLASKEFDHNELFNAMRNKMGRGGYEARRFGGSNGKPRFDEDLFEFIHQPGTICRKGVAIRLQVPPQHLCKWEFLYRSAYNGKWTKVAYAPPCRAGQLDPSKIDWAQSVEGWCDGYATIKTVFPFLLEQLNKQLGKYGTAKTAVADELLSITENWALACEDTTRFKALLKTSHTMTFLRHAVAMHRDVPHRENYKVGGDYSFMEYKMCWEVPRETRKLLSKNIPTARLRGGAGRKKAVVAVATHK